MLDSFGRLICRIIYERVFGTFERLIMEKDGYLTIVVGNCRATAKAATHGTHGS